MRRRCVGSISTGLREPGLFPSVTGGIFHLQWQQLSFRASEMAETNLSALLEVD